MTPAVAPTRTKTAVDDMVAHIDASVQSAEINDAVDLNSLLLALKSPASDQDGTALLLRALCYYSASLSSPMCKRSRASYLRVLTREAIYLDFGSMHAANCKLVADGSLAKEPAALAEPAAGISNSSKRVSFAKNELGQETERPSFAGNGTGPAEEAPLVSCSLLDAYEAFLINTVSADSALVEDVLDAFAFKLFRLPLPAFENVAAVALSVIPRILQMHAHAEVICIRKFGDLYPHPVRSAEEHTSYARGLLSVASRSKGDTLATAMISIVLEKMTVLDAMVPDAVWKPDAETGTPAGDALPCTGGEGSACAVTRTELEPEASKMDAVLVEFCDFVDDIYRRPKGPSRSRRFKAIIASVQRFVLSAHCPKHAPMTLLYATSRFGRDETLQVSESFRVSFHDPGLPVPLRASYLQYSAAIICRSSVITELDALAWLQRLTSWLHSYIDDHQNDDAIVVDVDVHELFYAGIFAFMSVVSVRLDLFGIHGNSSVGDSDVANNLRFLRIMMSELNPLLVMPSKLVNAFCKTVEDNSDMSFDMVLEDNLSKALPSRTRFGNLNHFSAFMPLSECPLPGTSARVRLYYSDGVRRRERYGIGVSGAFLTTVEPFVGTVAGSRKRSRADPEWGDDHPESEERYAKRIRSLAT